MLNKIITERRREKKLTMSQLAEKVGVSVVSVHSWEKGLYEPRGTTLLLLMDVLDINAEEILKGEAIEPTTV